MEKPLAKTLAAIIALLAVSFLQQSPTFAARSAPGKTIYSTSDTYSFTLNAGELFYSGTGPHISGPLYGVKFGYDAPGNSVLDSFGTEGSLYYFSSSSDGEQGDTTGYLFRIEEVLPFTPGERLVPFAAVGAGGIYTSDDKVSKALPFLNYGVGLKYFLTSAVALRADFRHILAFTLGGTDNFEVSTGISYYFGKKSPKKTEPTPEAKKSEDAQKSNGKSRKNEKDQKKEEQLAQEKKERERVAQELRDQERRKEEKLRKERLQKEWEEFEAQKQGKTAVAASPKTAPAKTEQIAETTIQPEQAPIAVAPEAAAPAGVPGAPLPIVVPGVAAGSTMAAALPPAAAEIAAEPAQTEVIVKSLPAEKTAATPPAAPLQATQPAALPAETALADQKIKVPARETVAKTTIQPEQAPIAVAPEAPAPAGVPGAPLPAIVPGVAAGSTMAAALPPAAAEIAAEPAQTEVIVKSLPAEKTAATPPAAPLQATQPAALPAETALADQKIKVPARETVAKTTIQPEQAPIAVAPEAAAPAGVPGAPLPAVVPGVAAGSTMAAALPPAAAEIAAEPAQTEVIVKSLPAEKTAATPPAAPLQATQPAALPAETALADQKIKVPARETVAKTTIQPEQAPIAVAPEAAAPAGVPGAPLPVVVPGVAAGSTMAAALPPAAAAQTPSQETGTTAITMDTPSAKIAASPALTGTGVKPLPAADTDVTPPAPPIQATPPATAPAATALVGQEVNIPPGKAGLSRTERGRENVVRELQINFDFDKSAVKKIYLSHIKQIAFLLKSNPGFSVIIEGHTDNIGSSKYNLNLSQRRAKSVKNDLVRQGVADKRIFTKGYGLTRPIASNLTVKGRLMNRRAVTIIIVTNNSIPKSR